MPRKTKPARLWQRSDGAWIILYRGRQHRTGFSDGELEAAQGALATFIALQKPERIGPAQPDQITVGEILARYLDDRIETMSSPRTLTDCMSALAPFWDSLTADAVKGSVCRRYVAQRGASASTARRDLGVLQAAVNYAHAEGLLVHPVKVTLPPAGEPKDRWLTRDEADALLRASPPHLRRFILISLSTGRRKSAVLALRWTPSLDSGWVDLERGFISFIGQRQAETKKRKGRVAITRQLSGHLERWSAAPHGPHVIEWKGERLASVKTAFHAAQRRAGLAGFRPHDLKHTAVTWAFQNGMTMDDAVDWFDTSRDTLERVYRQHSPEHQDRARSIMEKGER